MDEDLRERLSPFLPLKEFCYDINCLRTRSYRYALENDLPENIEVLRKNCEGCSAHLYSRYLLGETIAKQSHTHSSNLHLKGS